MTEGLFVGFPKQSPGRRSATAPFTQGGQDARRNSLVGEGVSDRPPTVGAKFIGVVEDAAPYKITQGECKIPHGAIRESPYTPVANLIKIPQRAVEGASPYKVRQKTLPPAPTRPRGVCENSKTPYCLFVLCMLY